MSVADLLFFAHGYKVFAVQKADGAPVWETELIAKMFKPSAPFVALVVEDDALYAAVNNQIFRLDPRGGNIIWWREIQGSWMGFSVISSMATSKASSVGGAQAAEKRAARL